MSQILTYNKLDINKQKDLFYNENIQNGYKLWADFEDPTAEEMYEIYRIFHIDKNVLKQYFKDSQKSQIYRLC